MLPQPLDIPILTATPCPASYGYHYIRAMATTDDMATYSSCLLGHLRPQLWLTAVQQSPAFPLAATAPISCCHPCPASYPGYQQHIFSRASMMAGTAILVATARSFSRASMAATAILVATARSFLLLLLLAWYQHRELTCDLLLPHCS